MEKIEKDLTESWLFIKKSMSWRHQKKVTNTTKGFGFYNYTVTMFWRIN
jgi:hypothetical protein